MNICSCFAKIQSVLLQCSSNYGTCSGKQSKNDTLVVALVETSMADFSEQGINGTDYNERMQGKTMRNKRDVWNISTNSYRMGEHFAMFPEQLVEPCIFGRLSRRWCGS